MVIINHYNEQITPKTRQKKKRKKNLPQWVRYERLEEIIRTWKYGELAKALFAFSYITGGRISEVLNICACDCEVVNKKGHEFLEITLKTLKTRDETKEYRTIPIPLDSYDRDMVLIALKWKIKFQPHERIFQISRFAAYRIMKKIDFGAMFLRTPKNERIRVISWYGHPHYLRHLRASHLLRYYPKFNDRKLMTFFGWSSAQMPARYSHADYDDLVDAFIDAKGG